jgi:uncharacterized protein YgiM (DUF1202 family)
MIGASTARSRLCPHCANSVTEDAAECFYCKANLSSEPSLEWLKRDESSSIPGTAATRRLPSVPAKFLWPATLLIVALLAFFAGAYRSRGDQSLLQANLKQVQAKDLMIQSQESQLAQARQKLEETSNQLAEIKTKLEENRKEASLAQQRLDAARQAAANTNRSVAPTRIASRAPAPASYPPQPAPARQSIGSGIYETTRPTSVHEDPSPSSRVISQVERGTRINVVGSNGGWLEVRSRRGNPPGYVRSDDARPSGAAN